MDTKKERKYQKDYNQKATSRSEVILGNKFENQGVAMKWMDSLYNRRMLKKFNVEYVQPPMIEGRMLIADFTDGWRGKIKTGANVRINSSIQANPVGGLLTALILKGPDAVIEIDDRAGISNAVIAAFEHVYIGQDVNIGAGVKILDTDFHPLDLDERIKNINIPHKPVRIERGAFIGTNAMILKGVTIGEESIIGAGAIVVKSVPPGEIWGGNPAKFIRKLKE